MAYEPLIRDSDGSGNVALRKATTTEENYLAYHMGLYLADSANIPNALLTTNASGGTAIGSHANTYYNAIIGQQVAFEDITTETVTLYQKNSVFDETDSDVRRVLEHSINDGQTRIDEFDSADITGLSNRLVSRVFTSDYPGTIKLATAAPSGDYTLVQEAFRDTRGNDDSDVNIYNIYKRTSMSAPDTIRPFSYKRSDTLFDSDATPSADPNDFYGYANPAGTGVVTEAADDATVPTAETHGFKQYASDGVTPAAGYGNSFGIYWDGTLFGTAVGVDSSGWDRPSDEFTYFIDADSAGANFAEYTLGNGDILKYFSIRRTLTTPRLKFLGLQALTDRQIGQTFGARARHLINPASSSVGAYQLRSAVQGAPTDAGTWVAKGTATDTRNVAVEEDYTRNCQVTRFTNFVGNYTGNYTGTFQNTTTNVYAGNYLRDFIGNFIGTYTGPADYESTYTGNYTGNFTLTYIGNYNPTYIGTFARDYTGDFARDYLRDFTGDFVGNFLRDNETGPYRFENDGINRSDHGYTWRYTTNAAYVDIWYESLTYRQTYSTTTDAANATILTVSGTGTALDGRTFVRGPIQINNIGSQFHYEIAERFVGADTGPLYVIDYTRNFAGNYTGDFVAEVYFKEYQGPHPDLGNYDYVSDFITQLYTGTYVGNYTATYAGEFLSSFTRNSTRNSTVNYTTEFTTTYTDSFNTGYTDTGTEYINERDGPSYSSVAVETYIGTFTGVADYQGLSNQFTRNDQIDSVGNYIAEFDVERDILETYVGTYAGDFVGDFIGDFTGFELSPANTTINTYTLYVRVA